MTRFVDKLLETALDGRFSTAVLVIAALSLIMLGYFLLVKSGDSSYSDRRR